LTSIYPDLNLKKDNFLFSNEGWKALERQRNFLDEFARANYFDPLDADQWKLISTKDIVAAGGSGMLYYYNRSLPAALNNLYPNLTLRGQKGLFDFKVVCSENIDKICSEIKK